MYYRVLGLTNLVLNTQLFWVLYILIINNTVGDFWYNNNDLIKNTKNVYNLTNSTGAKDTK